MLAIARVARGASLLRVAVPGAAPIMAAATCGASAAVFHAGGAPARPPGPLTMHKRLMSSQVGSSGSSVPAAPADNWMRDTRDGISITDPTIVNREHKCEAVFAALHEQPVRLLRSAPGSGKSSFGILMEHHGKNAGRKVHRLSPKPWVPDHWRACTGNDMAADLDPHHGDERTFIVDDAHALNRLGSNSPFWRAMTAINLEARTSRVQVLLLADWDTYMHCPVEIPSPYSLALLRLDAAELHAFFDAYNSTCTAKGYPRISLALQEALQRICNGHVAHLRSCVRLYCECYAGEVAITAEQQADFTAHCLLHISGRGWCGAMAGTIRDVALAGRDGIVAQETGGDLISIYGLHHQALAAESAGETRITIPSPAMRGLALRRLFGSRTRYPIEHGALLPAKRFVRELLMRMQRSDLYLPVAKRPLPPRGYQLAVAAAAMSLGPNPRHVAVELGKAFQPGGGARGTVDVYAGGGVNVGVELRQEGRPLETDARHHGIFNEYAPLKLKAVVVVDFRASTPDDATMASQPETLFVVVSANCRTATILQTGHAPVSVQL